MVLSDLVFPRLHGFAGTAKVALALLGCLATPHGAASLELPLAAVTLVGPPDVVFRPARHACDGDDVPDAPARAYRDAGGRIVLFASHYASRAMRAESFASLKLDCRVALPSGSDPDPKAYDDKSWIAATWTDDGRTVQALVHHEFQAHAHPGRCRYPDYLACWHNTVLALTSADGGASFPRPGTPSVVASTPFGQEEQQGRHRGFFNPSNIVADGRYRYMFAATTGWPGQPYGACLFRTGDPADPAAWRAYDGAAFTIRYADPYRAKPAAPPPACRPIAPFPAPVGAVVRHRASGAWLAVFQAKADQDRFATSGFYVTASRDLLSWDVPRLLLAGRTLYDDPCGAGGLIAYPSLIDPGAEGRNFDDVGSAADLYFTTLKVQGCAVTSDRDLVRRRVAIKVWP